jgi:hypothetical protein
MTAGEAHCSQLPKLGFLDYLTFAYPKRRGDHWPFANLTRISREVKELFSHIGECIPNHTLGAGPHLILAQYVPAMPSQSSGQGAKTICLTMFYSGLICAKPPLLLAETAAKA